MLRTIGRLIVVLFAMALAALVTGAIVVTLGLEKITHAMHADRGDDLAFATQLMDLLWQGGLLLSGVTIVPALLMVLVGEVARIRSWLYYLIGGGAAMAAIPLLARIDQAAAGVLPEAVVWQLFATAGFAGGFVYWLVAGRNA